MSGRRISSGLVKAKRIAKSRAKTMKNIPTYECSDIVQPDRRFQTMEEFEEDCIHGKIQSSTGQEVTGMLNAKDFLDAYFCKKDNTSKKRIVCRVSCCAYRATISTSCLPSNTGKPSKQNLNNLFKNSQGPFTLCVTSGTPKIDPHTHADLFEAGGHVHFRKDHFSASTDDRMNSTSQATSRKARGAFGAYFNCSLFCPLRHSTNEQEHKEEEQKVRLNTSTSDSLEQTTNNPQAAEESPTQNGITRIIEVSDCESHSSEDFTEDDDMM